MSRTFSLVCEETNRRIWIGQSTTATKIGYRTYTAEEEITNLNRWLMEHHNKDIRFICDDFDFEDSKGVEYWEYEDESSRQRRLKSEKRKERMIRALGKMEE